MLFIYNRILLIPLLNAVSNCTLHAFHVYFPHVLFSHFFVILHYHCIYYVFKYGILCISRHVLLEACNKDLLLLLLLLLLLFAHHITANSSQQFNENNFKQCGGCFVQVAVQTQQALWRYINGPNTKGSISLRSWSTSNRCIPNVFDSKKTPNEPVR